MLAPYPNEHVRKKLKTLNEWEACVGLWVSLLGWKLHRKNGRGVAADGDVFFLKTYCRERLAEPSHSALEKRLSEQVFTYVYAILSSSSPPDELLAIEFLLDYASLYGPKNHRVLRQLYGRAWSSFQARIRKEIQSFRRLYEAQISSLPATLPAFRDICARIAIWVDLCPQTFELFLDDKHLLDNVITLYNTGPVYPETALFQLANSLLTCIASFPSPETAKYLSWFLREYDHAPSLIRDIVTHTGIFDKLQQVPQSPEITSMVKVYGELRPAMPSKGKDRGSEKESADHDIALTQLVDIFPDHQIAALDSVLRKADDDVERATAELLALGSADEASDRKVIPSPAPPVQRRNVFDNDDFDRLTIARNQLHRGKKDRGVAEDLLDQKPLDTKQAIYAALSRFEADDDEYDDTYDDLQERGRIEAQEPDEMESAQRARENDQILMIAFDQDPTSLDRPARRTKARENLKSKTSMSDEQIEGWKIMLERDPKAKAKLGDSLEFAGTQPTSSTAYRKEATSAEESEGSARGRPLSNGPHGRGRGRGGRGGSGRSTAGAESSSNEAHQRARKDRKKASVANHSRKTQHAKKN